MTTRATNMDVIFQGILLMFEAWAMLMEHEG